MQSEYLYSCLKNDLKGATWLKTHPLSIIRDNSLTPLYLIEDSVESALPRILCGVHPGVTILTNYHFTYGGPEPIHNSPWKGIARKREQKEKDFWDPLFDWRNNGNVAEREVAVSGRVVFTSVEDRIASNSNATYIPFPLLPEDSLRIPNRSKSLLSCGGVSLEWRPEVFLLSSGLADRSIWLVDKHEIDQAKRLIDQYGAKNVELLYPRTPKIWRDVLRSGGVCFFGLFSGYHSLSPYIEMSLAASLPVITTDYGKGKEYQFVYRVPPGADEVRTTQSVFSELLKGESVRMSQDRHEYANDIFNAKSIAAEIEFLVAGIKPQQTWIAEEAREWVNRNAAKEGYLKEAFVELGW